MAAEKVKTVLVHLNERARPVKFSGGVTQLIDAIRDNIYYVTGIRNSI